MIYMIWVLSLVLSTSLPAFAEEVEEDTGYYMTTVVNGGLYSPEKPYYLMTYNGIYYSTEFYKEILNVDIVKDGERYLYKKGEKVIVTVTDKDVYDVDEEELHVVEESESGKMYFLFEAFADLLSDDFYYTWEAVRDPRTEQVTFKQVSIWTSRSYRGEAELEGYGSAIECKSIKGMKNLQNHIKKMAKKPVITGTTVSYTDKQCSFQMILNYNSEEPESTNFNIIATGRLSTEAVVLLTEALKDIVEPSDVKSVVDQLKRLTNVAAAPKTDQKTYDKINKRTYHPWYELGEYFKVMYQFKTIEKKNAVSYFITGFYVDTFDYNE